ncbi:MAG: hypothetical protein JW873_00170 [Candidatus Saganbacteria bacterium]|nr:hypothetical protein [Candidatus Saganbacteria bacterium]
MPKEDISQRIYRTLKEQEGRADLSFNKVTFEEASGSRKYWQLAAESAIVNKSTGLAALKNTHGLFFKNGRPALKFRSPAALWDMKKKEIYLDQPLGYDLNSEKQLIGLLKTIRNGPASVFTLPAAYRHGLGYWFRANNLSWKLADQQLICTGGIVLNKGEVTGYADQLTGDVEFKKVLLDGSPRVVIAPPLAAPITVEAAQFELNSAADVLTARGNPVVTWRTARVTAQTAGYWQADKKIKLAGDVRVSYEDISAWGAAANYLTGKELIILSGEARAEQGNSRLSSDQVMVSLKDRKISLLGKGKVVIPAAEVSP